MLSWVHFGDVHAADEDGWGSVDDLAALAADVAQVAPGAIDFAYLPGDIANHGTAEQYVRVRAALDGLTVPWFAIPGDHDFEPGSLDNFYAGLGVADLPMVVSLDDRRCLFLDLVSAGNGGPDFRLGASQTAWLRQQLDQAWADDAPALVFMHAFPGDLAADGAAIGQMFANRDVACVDTGHTHYNELLNDGRVIYTATRSTGQVEEGPVGASFHAVDGTVVSVRFKELARPWPFVVITSPADRRMITDATRRDQVPGTAFTVRAKVFGADIRTVEARIDDGPPIGMACGAASVWSVDLTGIGDGEHMVAVRATGPDGTGDEDRIAIRVSRPLVTARASVGALPGHDRHSVGAWTDHGFLGTQLGPNKNGREW